MEAATVMGRVMESSQIAVVWASLVLVAAWCTID